MAPEQDGRPHSPDLLEDESLNDIGVPPSCPPAGRLPLWALREPPSAPSSQACLPNSMQRSQIASTDARTY